MFYTKKELLAESDKAKEKIRVGNIGLVSWKYHSFLKPEQNRELQQLISYNIHQGIYDNIDSVVDSLVVRNTMSDWDYKDYKFNRDTDNDRKTHIIYGMGCLDGTIPNKLDVIIKNIEKHYTAFGKEEYFHRFEPMVVLHRNENAEFIFDKPGMYKLYGMTCEALGASIAG